MKKSNSFLLKIVQIVMKHHLEKITLRILESYHWIQTFFQDCQNLFLKTKKLIVF